MLEKTVALMPTNPFLLTFATLNQCRRYDNDYCRKCNLKLKIGDYVVTTKSVNRHSKSNMRKYYHEECWRKMEN